MNSVGQGAIEHVLGESVQNYHIYPSLVFSTAQLVVEDLHVFRKIGSSTAVYTFCSY